MVKSVIVPPFPNNPTFLETLQIGMGHETGNFFQSDDALSESKPKASKHHNRVTALFPGPPG